ncbi:branched-chain amino acid aminotransferase [Arboricoccus pini]|uniref:Probable branched-chain-amino-acid aminotransferase n=1 Tax=Arboricoccus pini TaxID=1963835 RepID=A0A212R2V6_9PROT|nr:aminodeoxychorismate lyase [Arboricoccus pini]SNB66266.1 branched-chain amino acid aminotransferase [Arboricoccus pini]
MFWYDGAIRQLPLQAFDLRDRGLLLGDGVFETVAIRNRTPFQIDAHLTRLNEGAARLGISFAIARASDAIHELAAAYDRPDAILRLTLTHGPSDRGLARPRSPEPTIFASISPWTPPRRAEPVRLVTASIRRNETSPSSRHKTLNYLDQIAALEEAGRRGADDALLLNTEGRPACASAANLFAVHGRTLLTPALDEGALPGTVRRALITAAPTLGFEPKETRISCAELLAADCVFLTNSVRFVRHVRMLDEKRYLDQSPYPDLIVNWLWAEMQRECVESKR